MLRFASPPSTRHPETAPSVSEARNITPGVLALRTTSRDLMVAMVLTPWTYQAVGTLAYLNLTTHGWIDMREDWSSQEPSIPKYRE